MLSSGEMKCGSSGVETGTTLREGAGDVTTGARVVLASTLGDVSTRRVVAGVAGTGATVRVVWVDRTVAPLGRPTMIT